MAHAQYPLLPRQRVAFSLFEPDWQNGQCRFDYVASMTGDELNSVTLHNVAVRFDVCDEWYDLECELIDHTKKIGKRFEFNNLVWHTTDNGANWRQAEFGEVARRQLEGN